MILNYLLEDYFNQVTMISLYPIIMLCRTTRWTTLNSGTSIHFFHRRLFL